MHWEWIIGLVVTGAALMGMEIYVPGFVLATIGGALQIAALMLVGGQGGINMFMLVAVIAIVLDAAAVAAAIRYFPKTRVGKRMILHHEQQIHRSSWGGEELQSFVDKEGVTEGLLRPSGTAMFDGRRMDVVSEGELLQRGTKVKVVAVKEGRLVVRKIT